MKNIASAALASAMLSSCGFVQQMNVGEPNASWRENAYYDDETGEQEAGLATVAYSRGNFQEAEDHLINALQVNPRQPQALMVGALMYEQTGRLNRSRQYYEDLILVGGDRTSLLGSENGTPEKMTDIAKRRLRLITMQQNRLVTEEPDGSKTFVISEDAARAQGKSAMEEALFIREKKLIAENRAGGEADRKAVEILFDDGEKNTVSRFLIMKELAEKDLITKDEFLSARMTNIGGLLPLTSQAPAMGLDRPVPSPDVILQRIDALKEAENSRAITPREFSAERNLIIEAILPPYPRTRAKNEAPARDIMSAAKEMRKIEVIYDLGLITAKEKDAEQKAIEKYLGMNKGQKPVKKTAVPKPAAAPVAAPAPKAETQTAAPVVAEAPKPAEEVTVQTTQAKDEPKIENTTAAASTSINSPATASAATPAVTPAPADAKAKPNTEMCKEMCGPTPLLSGITTPF